MATPFHQYASIPLATPAATVHARLTAQPAALIAAATADALTTLAPHVADWGLAATELPGVTADATEPDELGAAKLRWYGDEAAGGWPSLVARLLIVARPTGGSRLALVSPRSPAGELTTARLERLHRRRVVDVAVQRFLHHLGGHLDGAASTPGGPAAGWFERTPMFVHHLHASSGDPQRIAVQLAQDGQGLAERATRVALDHAREVLAAGRFRADADPQVAVRTADPGELGSVRVRWCSDEEASGWPALELALDVEAHEDGARLAVLGARPPGYDLSRNRLDKHQRDRVLRTAGADLVAAIAAELTGTAPSETPAGADRRLATMGT